jgi:hypothetical protein
MLAGALPDLCIAAASADRTFLYSILRSSCDSDGISGWLAVLLAQMVTVIPVSCHLLYMWVVKHAGRYVCHYGEVLHC